jgi:hypothetical protein
VLDDALAPEHFKEIAIDGGLEVGDGAEDAALEALSGERGEEVLDGVEPGARGWHEVEHPARMAGEPTFDFGMLMGGVVIKDGVDRLVGRHRALDPSELASSGYGERHSVHEARRPLGRCWKPPSI